MTFLLYNINQWLIYVIKVQISHSLTLYEGFGSKRALAILAKNESHQNNFKFGIMVQIYVLNIVLYLVLKIFVFFSRNNIFKSQLTVNKATVGPFRLNALLLRQTRELFALTQPLSP